MDDPVTPNSINARRGHRLAPIQTDFSKPEASPTVQEPRTRRPRPVHDSSEDPTGERVPLQPQAVKRQSSRTSLRNIFSRSKSTRKSNNDGRLPVIDEGQNSATRSKFAAAIPSSPASTMVSTPTLVLSPVTQTPKTRNPLKPNSKPAKEKALPTITAWDPPPLFQAYPQAIKHACLLAPCLSADSILRVSATRRRSSSVTEDAHGGSLQNPQSAASDAARKKKEGKEKKHSRKVSGSISKTEWTQKIYVLVTSGYLLQYAGDGNFDRLPEKMMQLGSTSVAFASDAIPGKHWVLQISQSSGDGGTVALDGPKNLFSRLGFHSAETRRSARSFLMVHNSPEEMNSWLVAVRREIDSLGGKKYVAESPSEDGATHQLQSKPSFRYLVKRDPNQFPSPLLEPSRSPVSSVQKKNSVQEMRTQIDLRSNKSMNRRSMPARSSTDAPSVSTATTITDLDLLREGSRLSYASGSARTIPSSSCSSPALSPVRPDAATPKFSHLDYSIGTHSRPAAISPGQKRQSMYTYSPTQIDRTMRETHKSPRPQSAVPETLMRSASPPAPNFSVPLFSRKLGTTPGCTRTPHPLSDIENMTHPGPLSPPLRNKYSATEADSQPEPATPKTQKDFETRSVKSRKRLSSGYDASVGIVASTRFSPTSSSPSTRTENSRLKRLSSLESTGSQAPSSRSGDVLADLPEMDGEERAIGSSRFQRVLHVPQPNALGPSPPIAQPQLYRPMSMQMRPEITSSPPHKSEPANGKVLRGSSSTIFRQGCQRNKIAISNSAMIGAAASQTTHPPTVRRVSPRKSMPDLSLGPPSAPPPNCPLPEVPPAVISHFQPAWRGDLVSQKASMSPPRKNLDGRRTHSERSKVQPDHISVHGITNMSPRELSMINAF